MGLICLQLVRCQKAGFDFAIDPLEYRLEMSQTLGADAVLNPFKSDAGEILWRSGDFDVVIEAAGTQSALDLSTHRF
jgi:threonine dehydrogenase-like Zn-dependent dehydrogenase